MLRKILLPPMRQVPQLLVGLACLAFAAGCGKDNVSGPNQVPLTLRAMGSGSVQKSGVLAVGTTAGIRYAAAAQADTVPVTFTRALLVVRDVQFVLNEDEDDSLDLDDDSTAIHEDDESEAAVVFHGPFVIDLLAQSAESLGTQLVPPGIYHQIQGHLSALHASDWNAAQFSFLVGSTVLLEGTVNGDGGGPFTYQTRIDEEFILRGPYNVQAGSPATAFLTFDLSRWLVGQNGTFLDPRVADNDKWIRWAIRHAIKVTMDGNHDGELDD